MKTVVDLRLREEAARFALRFACEDCVNWRASAESCAHGYPAEPRKGALAGDELAFCKEWELGASSR